MTLDRFVLCEKLDHIMCAAKEAQECIGYGLDSQAKKVITEIINIAKVIMETKEFQGNDPSTHRATNLPAPPRPGGERRK